MYINFLKHDIIILENVGRNLKRADTFQKERRFGYDFKI